MSRPDLVAPAIDPIFDSALAEDAPLFTAIEGLKAATTWLRYTLALAAPRACFIVITDPDGPTVKKIPVEGTGTLLDGFTASFPAPFKGGADATVGLTYHLEYTGTAVNVDFCSVETLEGGP